DAEDPGAGALLTLAVVTDPARRLALLREAWVRHPESAEVPLRLVRELIAAGNLDDVEKHLTRLAERDPFDWRVTWLRGRLVPRPGGAGEAGAASDAVNGEVPGEPAAPLAVALAAELAGDAAGATRLYALVSRVDPGYATAVFGLARCLGC